MRLLSLTTAVPARSISAAECAAIAAAGRLDRRVNATSQRIIRRLLASDYGVASRNIALGDLEAIFDRSADELHHAFRAAAPALAADALAPALDAASLRARDLDALLVCTCTGYLCPGITSYVAEQLGLRADAFLQDLVGLGCGAAIPLLRAADALIARQPGARVACIAVEICSAAFFLDDDLGVIVSALLFGDGATASIWTGDGHAPAGCLRAHGFSTVHQPEHRDRIRFETRDGKLRNLLHRSVPELAARAVRQLYDASGGDALGTVLTHGGGKDVLDHLEAALPGRNLSIPRGVLRDHGNMSSPSVLFALRRHLDADPGADRLWLSSFGAGFSCHACHLDRAG